MTTNRMGLTPEQASNSFSDEELEMMQHGNNPQANALRELLSYRTASKEPIAVLYRTGNVLTREQCIDDDVFTVCCKVETPLYAATPLQAVTVPDEMTFAKVVVMKSLEYSKHTTGICGYLEGWNAAIAAMNGDKK